MRKLAIIVSGAVVVGVAALMVTGPASRAQQAAAPSGPSTAKNVMMISDTGSLKGPRQPIFFRHDVHAGLYKIQCQYCHYTVDKSTEPGIPSVQTCMGCHLVISGTDSGAKAEIKKLRQAWNDKKPIEWNRIHIIARFAHFPHQRHIAALGPNACATCHGDVTRMPQVFKVNNVTNMGFCISCHLERKVTRDCTVCHY